MATSMRAPRGILSMASTLAASTPEGSIVVQAAGADDTVALPGGAAPTTPLLGLLFQDQPATANLPAQVVTAGVFPGIAGASITRGAELTAFDATGKVATAAPAAGTNVGIIGIALESASAGERVAILIKQYVKQG